MDRVGQVYAADITYIPMEHGFAYLVAVIDWHSRRVLSCRLSNTMDVSFCVEAVQEAILKYGAPAVFNTDQGSQFTADDFTNLLRHHDVKRERPHTALGYRTPVDFYNGVVAKAA